MQRLGSYARAYIRKTKCYKCYYVHTALIISDLRVHFVPFMVLPRCYRKCYRSKNVIFQKGADFSEKVNDFLKNGVDFLEIVAVIFPGSIFGSICCGRICTRKMLFFKTLWASVALVALRLARNIRARVKSSQSFKAVQG